MNSLASSISMSLEKIIFILQSRSPETLALAGIRSVGREQTAGRGIRSHCILDAHNSLKRAAVIKTMRRKEQQPLKDRLSLDSDKACPGESGAVFLLAFTAQLTVIMWTSRPDWLF